MLSAAGNLVGEIVSEELAMQEAFEVKENAPQPTLSTKEPSAGGSTQLGSSEAPPVKSCCLRFPVNTRLPHAPGHIPTYIKNHKQSVKDNAAEMKRNISSAPTDLDSDLKLTQAEGKTRSPSDILKPSESFACKKPTTAARQRQLSSLHQGDLHPGSRKASNHQSPDTPLPKTKHLERRPTSLVLSTFAPKNLIADPVEVLKRQLFHASKQADNYRKEKEDAEKALKKKNDDLRLKEERITFLEQSLENRKRESKRNENVIEKLRNQDTPTFNIEIDELKKEVSAKDDELMKLKKDLHQMENLVDEKIMLSDKLTATISEMKEALEAMHKECDKKTDELNSRTDDSRGRSESIALEDEYTNPSIKHQQLKQENQTLTSKLAIETQKISRLEDLLTLRLQNIETLQESDEINKTRLTTQAEEFEDLQRKLTKAKNFRAATEEELNNMYNTIKSQHFEIESLKFKLTGKNKFFFNTEKPTPVVE